MDNVSLWTCDILWRRSCQVAIAVFLRIMYIQDALVFFVFFSSTIFIIMVTPLTSQLAKPESDVLLKPCCNTKCSRWANQPDHPSCCGACLSTTLEQPVHSVQCGERQELIRKAIREDWTIIGRVDPEGHELRSHPSSTWHVNQHQLLPVYKC